MLIVKYQSFGILLFTGRRKRIKFIHNESDRQNRKKIYLNAYAAGSELYRGLKTYFEFYNFKRPHQSLDYMFPANIYRENLEKIL
jgi:transposase InsO family protein